jgi:transposase
MRGVDNEQQKLFSYISVEKRISDKHPIRLLRIAVDKILSELSADFDQLYSVGGRPSIPPEQLLRALLLQILYTVRSERQLMEQLNYNLLFRWFVGLNMDDSVWDPTTFSKNRDRFLDGDIAAKFFSQVLGLAKEAQLLSNEHFSVDGTLLESWASHKSFTPKDDENKPLPPGGKDTAIDFHGQKRSNETHQSTTDPEARLFKKSKGSPAKLCYMGHAGIENRNGIVVTATTTIATGTAEREAAQKMAAELSGSRRITLAGDKNYDTKDFVRALRELNVTPHVSQNNTNRRSAIDERTTRHVGYQTSVKKRKRIEQVYGWLKTIGGFRKLRFIGLNKVDWMYRYALSTYNLVRIGNLLMQAKC